MQLPKFFSGQKVLKSIWDFFTSSTDTDTSNRIMDFHDSGIIKGGGEFLMTVVGSNLNVGAGVAYDSNGQRICVIDASVTFSSSNITNTTYNGSSNVLTPQDSGSYLIPLTSPASNYVWLRYVNTVDTSVYTLHKYTNDKQFYEQYDGYEIQITTSSLTATSTVQTDSPFLYLGEVVMPSGTISYTGRQYFKLKEWKTKIVTPLINLSDRTTTYALSSSVTVNSYFLDDHIRAIGSSSLVSPYNPHGTSLYDAGFSDDFRVSLHNQVQHTAGLFKDYDIDQCLKPYVINGSGEDDALGFKVLGGNETLVIYSKIVSSTAILGTLEGDHWRVNLTGLADGDYYIYIDYSNNQFAVPVSTSGYSGYPIGNDYTKLTICKFTINTVGGFRNVETSSLIDLRTYGSISNKDISHYSITSYQEVPSGSKTGTNGVPSGPSYKETPSGSKTGTTGFDGNQNFILSYIPVANSEHVFVNGIFQEPGTYVAPGTATTGGSTTSLVASGSPGWTTNQWIGYTIAVYDVTGSLWNLRKITGNTANTITVTEAFDFTPTTSDTYEIGNDYSMTGTSNKTIHFVAGSIPPVDSTLRVTYDILAVVPGFDGNPDFILEHIPVSGSEHVYVNGVLQEVDINYTMTGTDNSTVHFLSGYIPTTDSKLRVTYDILRRK